MTTPPIRCYERDLTPGDILPGKAGARLFICHIERVGYDYRAHCMNLATRERVDVTLVPGHGYQTVIGGPKFAQPECVWVNPLTGKHIWKPEGVRG